MLEQMEAGKLDLGQVETAALSDPMYGGNKDMIGWKLIGFPGARYDFRDVIEKRNQDLRVIPVSMIERST